MKKARRHMAWTAIGRVIDRLKPVDKAVRGTVNKPPGRNEKRTKMPNISKTGIQVTTFGNVGNEVGMSSQWKLNGISIDTDADGLPDGWMDGWVYRSSPLDPSQERTYQNTMDLANIEMKYDAARWMDGGNPDNMLQVYEGEDLDCNGAVAESGAWNFMNDTKERTPNFKETDSTMEDSEPAANQIPDGIPDGYEVWYSSMMEPVRKLNGDLFFSPLTNDTYKDDDLIEDTLYQPQNGETLGPTFFGPEGSVIALAQRVYFGANSVFGGSADISKITRIQAQLNMSKATNLKLTLEIWDYRLDYISYDPESPPSFDVKPLAEGITCMGSSDGWYSFNVPNNVFTGNPGGNAVFYIVLRHLPGNPMDIGWYHHTPPQYSIGFSSLYQGITGLWHRDETDLLYNIKLIVPDANGGDKAPFIAEYIAGTNPKDPNSDYICTATLDRRGAVNDYLMDGYEMGWDCNELFAGTYPDPVGGVIFRTTVPDGAISGGSYTGAQSDKIWYDPDGNGSSSWETVEYIGGGLVTDPPSADESLFAENILIFTLEDGTEIYERPDCGLAAFSNATLLPSH